MQPLFEKKINTCYITECVFVDLDIQHAMRMCHIVICGLPGSTIFFHIISWMAQLKKKKVIEYKICVWFSLQLLSKAFLILRKTEWNMIKNVYLSSCKVPIILVQLQWNLNFINRFLKTTEILNFTKIHPVEAELLCADKQTWRI